MTGIAMKVGPGHNSGTGFDVERIREDFPILGRQIYGKPLVYLDNGASAQKPRAVIDRLRQVYEEEYSNVHRGAHFLSSLATDAFEQARSTTAAFINAASDEEIVFTRNATEAINLVAHSYAGAFLEEGDEIVISAMEHHANIVPWQLLRDRLGLVLKVAPISDRGELLMEDFERLLGARTRLVAITHCSNVLGTVNPAKEIIRLAHDRGVPVLLDGAQAAVHGKVDVRDLDVDFYAFTGHKLYGPSGIGVLYGKAELLDKMPPYQGGGEMIETVSFEKATFKAAPHRFEAGTPPIAQAIGLGAAIDYVTGLGMENIARHEAELLAYANERLAEIAGLRILGQVPGKAAIVSFVVDGIHSYDVATILDRAGVAVRVGHHCAEPLMARFGVDATLRASFGLYNTRADVDTMVAALHKAKAVFG
ncbi:MAG: cysteine desulfurase [Kiloniellales bacterium]|nr:cysteine desulfurase [Kiloniellales bacterium]